MELEKPVADLGYQSADFVLPFILPRCDIERLINSDLSRIRARHEHVNQQLKAFAIGISPGKFRHSRRFHVQIFFALCNVVQLKMVEDPLEDVSCLLPLNH